MLIFSIPKKKLGRELCSNFLYLKTLLRKNVLNDVTAAPFSVSFSQLPAVKKDTENGAVVTSLRTFIRSSAFDR